MSEATMMSGPARLSDYGIGTRADPNVKRRAKNCLNCGRFLPSIPEGWEIEEHGETMNDSEYEYNILFHDCNTGTALEMMVKRKKTKDADRPTAGHPASRMSKIGEAAESRPRPATAKLTYTAALSGNRKTH